MIKNIAVAFFTLTLAACSSRDIYNAVQHNNELKCNRLPQAQQEDCMHDGDQSYEEYERERKELLEE